MSQIHKNIIAIRKKRSLSQSQVSELANIPIRTYQRIESGQTSVNLDYLNRLAEGFQCQIHDILHFDLDTNRFPQEFTNALEQKNHSLEEENGNLRQFIDRLLSRFKSSD